MLDVKVGIHSVFSSPADARSLCEAIEEHGVAPIVEEDLFFRGPQLAPDLIWQGKEMACGPLCLRAVLEPGNSGQLQTL